MSADLIVPFAVDLLLKSSAVLVFTWLTLQICWRASAAQRGCVWCVALALIAMLPFTRLVAPHWALVFSKASAPAKPTLTVGPSEPHMIISDEIASAPPVQTWAMPDGVTLGVGVWLAGIFLLVTYRSVGAFLLYHCRRLSSPLQDKAGGNRGLSIGMDFGMTRPVDIRMSRSCQVPVTWGTWRPVVMFPAEALDWPQEWLESALRHEMGHVKNYDHLKRLLAFLVCVFYWPNPLVWSAAKQLQLAQEEASDNLVLRVGVSPQAYATQLIELIRSTAGRGVISIPAVAMARPSTLEGRLSAILDDTRNRGSADRRLVLMGTGLSIVLGLMSGAVQLRAADASSQEAVSPAPSTVAKPGAALMQQKIDSIIIDKIYFDKADITEVLQSLTQKSKELDPDHQGISFVLQLSGNTPVSGTPAPINPGIHREITIALENIRLGKIFNEIAHQTNLQYYVEDHAVYFRPAIDESEVLTVRTYLVPDNLFKMMSPAPGNSASTGSDTVDVKEQLAKLGFRFPVGATAIFLPASGKMVVHNTPEQLDLIANLIGQMSKPHASAADTPGEESNSPTDDNFIARPDNESGQAMMHKLKSIIIDKVNFDKVDIAVALRFFSEKRKELDPDKKGINFVLLLPDTSAVTMGSNGFYIHREFTVLLDNVPLDALLGYVCQQTNLKCSIEGDTVYFRP